MQEIKNLLKDFLSSDVINYIKNVLPNNMMTREMKNESFNRLFLLIIAILLIKSGQVIESVIIFYLFFIIYRKINSSAKLEKFENNILNHHDIIDQNTSDNKHKNNNLLNQINRFAYINHNAENINEFLDWSFPNKSICKNNPKQCIV